MGTKFTGKDRHNFCDLHVDIHQDGTLDMCVMHKKDEKGYVVTLSSENALRLKEFLNDYYKEYENE